MNRGSVVRLLVVGLLLAASSGCGEPLVTGDYRGEPLLQLEGRILMESGSGVASTAELRVAMFWLREVASAQGDALAGRATEQPVVLKSQFPARYAITLYTPPDDVPLQVIPEGSGEVAFALLLLYLDTNGDGAFQRAEDRLVGGTDRYLVAWTPDGARSSLVGGRLSAGYHLMRLGDAGACLEGTELLLMQTARRDASVDLTVTADLEAVLPDVDCDGFVDLCDSLLDALEQAPDEQREELELSWRACVGNLWEREDCASLLEAEAAGEVIPAIYRDLLNSCRESPNTPPLYEACELLLELPIDMCSPDGASCELDSRRLYELCLDPQVQGDCAGPLHELLLFGLGNLEQTTSAVTCILGWAEGSADEPPRDCQTQAYETCAPLEQEGDPNPDDDARWVEYERCLGEQLQRCNPNNGSCEPLTDRVASCQEVNCFEEGLSELEQCRGGLTAEDSWLCDWWLWEQADGSRSCDPGVCEGDPEEGYARCRQRFELATDPGPDPDPELEQCERLCQSISEDSLMEPDMGEQLREGLQSCAARFDGLWMCCTELLCCTESGECG